MFSCMCFECLLSELVMFAHIPVTLVDGQQCAANGPERLGVVAVIVESLCIVTNGRVYQEVLASPAHAEHARLLYQNNTVA